MHLAGKLSKFEVVDWNGRTSDHLRWWDMFVEDMTIELLEDICHQVLDLYSQTQSSQTAAESPPPSATTRAPQTPSSHPHSAQASPLNNTSTPQCEYFLVLTQIYSRGGEPVVGSGLLFFHVIFKKFLPLKVLSRMIMSSS